MTQEQVQCVSSAQLQKEHYDTIAHLYEAHYDDPCSQLYRYQFMYKPMFDGIKLSGMRVLEAMCGSGQTTNYLLSKGSSVTGLDISAKAIDSFRKNWPECDAICASALDSGLESNSFDCVAVVGGLHHMHPNLREAIFEIHRILKPSGYFCFVEPHAGSIPNLVRKQWYKRDSLFSDNEAAIDIEALKDDFASAFIFHHEIYQGNVAYIFVLNSMVLRIPLQLKPTYTRFVMALESMVNRLQGKLLSCYVIAQWQKR